MPPKPTKTKKKKGHSPAHQNEFSFQHNPKSKKTAIILATPIQHVCRRCRDKLDWRKQYRKYKPLTAPGTCNHCKKRNVRAAYHTLCESCTQTSPQSLKLLKEWNQPKKKKTAKDKNVPSEELLTTEKKVEETIQSEEAALESVVPEKQEETIEPKQPTRSKAAHHRVCAMCAKEPSLAGPDDYDDEDLAGYGQTRLRLRERKTLLRQHERETTPRKVNKVSLRDIEAENASDGSQNSDSESEEMGENAISGDEDPFLKAVGGADKLLTGEAYQQMLLQQEKLQIS